MKESKKISKRTFFDVKTPITSTKIQLYGESAEELDGKVITLDMTRSLRGKNIVVKLKVKNEGGALSSEPVSLELVGSFIRRMIHGGTDYVEDSFVTTCKDGQALVKFFMITRKKVSRSIRNDIRLLAKEHIISQFAMRTTKELFNEIMTNKIQKELSLKLKKIYPLSLCEIRIFKILEEKK